MSTIKLTEVVSNVAFFVRYLLTAKHRKGHGIHSPFIYDLVAHVIHDNSSYKEYAFFEELQLQLKNTETTLEIVNFGYRSKKFSQSLRKVSEMVRISSVNEKYGRLLFRLSKFYTPNNILELGTSIGLATTYLSKGYPKTKIVTLEGNESLCSFAHKLFHENRIHNIDIRQGLFDELLPKVLPELSNHCLIFIDGNHSYEPTLHYFQSIFNYFEECMIVFDDINWSSEMRKAWKVISTYPQAHVTIDMFFMGIVIRNKNITPGTYKVWF
jgi:predicted O-methyltransferase YrrM